jgi:hypothetical protein
VPTTDAYCTDQPVRSTFVDPRLYSSMKSFVYVAPLFPPPPYTWLRTTFVETAAAGGGTTAIDPAATSAAVASKAPARPQAWRVCDGMV